MNDGWRAILFAGDVLLVAGLGWVAVRGLAREAAGLIDRLLGWGVAAVALVALPGILLGLVGGLGLGGFLSAHLAMAVAVAWIRRSLLREDLGAARELGRDLVAVFRRPPVESVPAALLVAVALGLVVLAGLAEPVVYDSLTYRFSRIGLWLQEGNIGAIATDDARLNYMPVVPDVVMAWVLTPSSSGYQPAAAVQAAGGVLLLLATVGLALATGLGRPAALGSAGLVFAMANVVPQFTAAYTDLFTAGILAAGFVLWLRALKRGQGSWLGGIAAGLALGSKGTVVYFAPGLAIAVVWLGWRHRRSGGRPWVPAVVGAVLAAAVAVGPLAFRNHRDFGHVLAPREFVLMHHGETPGLRASWDKLRLNLAATFVQLCEPNSQPPWWRGPVQSLGEVVAERLPAADPYMFMAFNRREELQQRVYASEAPDADIASTGMLLPLLALGAALAAAWRRRSDERLVLVWLAALGGYVLFLQWRVLWHPYQFRFMVLVAPWLAVLAGWALQRLPRLVRPAGWTIALAAATWGLADGVFVTHQSGLPAIRQPTRSFGGYMYQRWRDWLEVLEPAAGPLRPALPVNALMAAFVRRDAAQPVVPGRLSLLDGRTAAECVRPGDGWLVVPAGFFVGREGAVFGRTLLLGSDGTSPFSLAAYRALRPGEAPPAMVYGNKSVGAGADWRRELLVRTWGAAPLRLELHNRGAEPFSYSIRSPLERPTGTLPVGGRRVVAVAVPSDFPVLVVIDGGAGATGQAGVLEVTVLP